MGKNVIIKIMKNALPIYEFVFDHLDAADIVDEIPEDLKDPITNFAQSHNIAPCVLLFNMQSRLRTYRHYSPDAQVMFVEEEGVTL